MKSDILFKFDWKSNSKGTTSTTIACTVQRQTGMEIGNDFIIGGGRDELAGAKCMPNIGRSGSMFRLQAQTTTQLSSEGE